MAPSASIVSAPERLVVVGGSAGSLPVLLELFASWPWTAHTAALVVVHRRRDASGSLEKVFGQHGVRVEPAQDRCQLRAGGVLIAPPDYHLLVADRTRVALSLDPPLWHCRPAIDVAFESAARCFGSRLTAVLLSGANNDGALGAAAVARFGGRVLVQDPSEAEVARMPQAAIDAVLGATIARSSAMIKLLED